MPFCAHCGAAVEGTFCPSCGKAVGGGAAPGGATPGGATPGGAAPGGPAPGSPTAAGMTDNVAGALCYLVGVITGILFLVLEPYNRKREVRFHAFQSIFLSLAWFAVWIALSILSLGLSALPLVGGMLGAMLSIVVWLGFVGLWVTLLIKTFNGQKWVLPVIGPMAEKQAG